MKSEEDVKIVEKKFVFLSDRNLTNERAMFSCKGGSWHLSF